MRAILDPNVIISALLSRDGTPARVLRAWLEGRFDLIVSPLLLDELERALAYPKLAERIKAEEATALIDWLRREAILVEDPAARPTSRSEDPGDDYLLALAEVERRPTPARADGGAAGPHGAGVPSHRRRQLINPR